MKPKITVEQAALGDRVSIEFSSGDVVRFEPDPKGEPRVEVTAQGFKALTIRPKVSNVIEVSLIEL